MIIKFNGLLEKRSKGCNCKGSQKSEYSFTSSKMFILPSGKTMRFIKDKEEEVEDRDGAFLLSYNTKDINGTFREVFTEVK